jgi:hypothetical protein
MGVERCSIPCDTDVICIADQRAEQGCLNTNGLTSRKSQIRLLRPPSANVGDRVSKYAPYIIPEVISSAFQNHVLAIPRPTTSSHVFGRISYISLKRAFWNRSSQALIGAIRATSYRLAAAVTMAEKSRGEGVPDSGLAVKPWKMPKLAWKL